jgi:hypothetical protein
MPNIHLRDLPPVTLETLKGAAGANGRSLNAELILLLNEEADRIRRAEDFRANVKRRKPRKPVDLEELIREDRDSRAAKAL